jgi:hypothetical protein
MTAGNKWNYIPKPCEHENCRYGDNCLHAHSIFETSFHPLVYKLKMCDFKQTKGHCNKGDLCSYAHDEHDVRTKDVWARGFDRETYKTQECSYKCQQENCTYFHYPSERRRDERKFQYRGIPCRHAFSSGQPDPSLCSKGDSCGFSHTKNELSYHHDTYRTKPCNNPRCNPTLCTFKHSDSPQDDFRRDPSRPQDSEWRRDHHRVDKQDSKNEDYDHQVLKEENPEEEEEKDIWSNEENLEIPQTLKKTEENLNQTEENLQNHEKKIQLNQITSKENSPSNEVDIIHNYTEKKSNHDEHNSETDSVLEGIENRVIVPNEEDNQNIRKYLCKKCSKNYSKFILGCGKPVCFDCISGPCVCGISHITKLD